MATHDNKIKKQKQLQQMQAPTLEDGVFFIEDMRAFRENKSRSNDLSTLKTVEDLYYKYFAPDSLTAKSKKFARTGIYAKGAELLSSYLKSRLQSNQANLEILKAKTKITRWNFSEEYSKDYYSYGFAAMMLIICCALITAAFMPLGPIAIAIFIGVVVATSSAWLISLTVPFIYNFVQFCRNMFNDTKIENLNSPEIANQKLFVDKMIFDLDKIVTDYEENFKKDFPEDAQGVAVVESSSFAFNLLSTNPTKHLAAGETPSSQNNDLSQSSSSETSIICRNHRSS